MNSDEKNKNLCVGCTICCEHVAIEIDKPENREELLKLLNYLKYDGFFVFIEDNGEWYIEFKSRCKQLDDDGHCKIYKDRPKICRQYSQEECEKHGEGEFFEHIFKSQEKFLEFIKKDDNLNKIFNSSPARI